MVSSSFHYHLQASLHHRIGKLNLPVVGVCAALTSRSFHLSLPSNNLCACSATLNRSFILLSSFCLPFICLSRSPANWLHLSWSKSLFSSSSTGSSGHTNGCSSCTIIFFVARGRQCLRLPGKSRSLPGSTERMGESLMKERMEKVRTE